ncbi:MAG: hypothetical protein R2848_06750 [Thermomicrobiales bacterium]
MLIRFDRFEVGQDSIGIVDSDRTGACKPSHFRQRQIETIRLDLGIQVSEIAEERRIRLD